MIVSTGGERTADRLGRQPLVVRLTGGILFALAALLLSVAMKLPEQGYTFLLLYPAIVASTYAAGRDTGLAATATAALGVAVLMISTWNRGSDLLLVQVASLLLFVAIGAGSCILMSELTRALRELEHSNEQLRQANQATLAASIETDLLLRELRHRVRNDLANIIAILRLQIKSCTGEAARQLAAAAERLQVLVQVHRRLSRQGHSPVVEMKGFLEELCADLRTTLLPLKPVALETRIEAMELLSTRAVAVGLIINELVTNAMKYAFPDGSAGTIGVYLTCANEMVEVIVKDDGAGIPVEAPGEGGGLGQKLVRSMAAQLGGTFRCQSGAHGTSCTVVFPTDEPMSSRNP